MLLQFCLLAAAEISAGSSNLPQHPPEQRIVNAPPTDSRPVSAEQAEAAMVDKFNHLVNAMKEFSARYKGSHTVNARKAQEVRRAWKEFETAESAYQNVSRQGR